jgi:methionyl-tRNA formyltransferase
VNGARREKARGKRQKAKSKTCKANLSHLCLLVFASCLLPTFAMRLVFLGTPHFAVPTLERLVEASHQVLAVCTQPDRPKGRGHELTASPVKLAALRLGLPVCQPERINRPEVAQSLAKLQPESMVIVGYGQIIPQSIIDLAPQGITNVHASLLPKYRGAAPIQWAVARGETVTGVTTMRIDAGLDTGDILLQRATPIGPEETAVELGERLAVMGAELLTETLQQIEAGTIIPTKQDAAAATYAPILKKEDGRIRWNLPASEILNQVRGFVPWPGAWSRFHNQLLHIWKARGAETAGAGAPGSLHPRKRRLFVTCGQSTTLELLELQLEGRKRMPMGAFLNGQHLTESEFLGERET